ncbi:hypothetical protein ACVMIH_007585 [Bradyrhizobium sp. USDA 4503]
MATSNMADRHARLHVSLTTKSFCSVVNRRRRATPVMTSTFENVSDIGVCLGLGLAPPANAGVRSKRGQFTVRVFIGSHSLHLADGVVPEVWGIVERESGTTDVHRVKFFDHFLTGLASVQSPASP